MHFFGGLLLEMLSYLPDGKLCAPMLLNDRSCRNKIMFIQDKILYEIERILVFFETMNAIFFSIEDDRAIAPTHNTTFEIGT